MAQSQLRSVMTIMGTHVLSHPEVYISFKPEVFAPDGTVLNDGTAKFLKGFLDAFETLVAKVS